MRDFLTVEDIRWNKGWRDEEEDRKTHEREKQSRELAEAEKKRQQARETREQKQAPANWDAWYAAVDGRFNEHLKSWLWGAIDDRIQQHLDRHEDIFKDAVGAALGTIRKQVRDEFKLCLEKQQCSFEAKLTEQKERFLALHNSADGVQGQAQLRAEVKNAFGEMCGAFGTQLAALEERLKVMPGRLPPVKSWKPETVFYAGDVVTCDGSLFQASRDTGQSVTHADWTCLARAGCDGHDGLTPNVRGRFEAYKKYRRLDVVEFDGSSFVALRDNPGLPPSPGDGWQLLSRSGRRGPAGERGLRGTKGEKGEKGAKGDAPEIVGWHLERKTYRAFPVLADGKMGPELNLRPLFEQFFEETSHAVE